MRIGTSRIALVSVDGVLGARSGDAPGPEDHNVDRVCLRVSPWDAELIRSHLSANGIDDVEIISRYGDGSSIYLDDPEGNMIGLKGPPWPPEIADHNLSPMFGVGGVEPAPCIP